MSKTNMIVVNSRTGESYITDSEEAKIITSEAELKKYVKTVAGNSRFTSLIGVNTSISGKGECVFMASFGVVYVSDVFVRNWKAYPDTTAARILYMGNK